MQSDSILLALQEVVAFGFSTEAPQKPQAQAPPTSKVHPATTLSAASLVVAIIALGLAIDTRSLRDPSGPFYPGSVLPFSLVSHMC